MKRHLDCARSVIVLCCIFSALVLGGCSSNTAVLDNPIYTDYPTYAEYPGYTVGYAYEQNNYDNTARFGWYRGYGGWASSYYSPIPRSTYYGRGVGYPHYYRMNTGTRRQ